MGRFHRHDDGTVHAHDHGDHPHEHHHHHDHGHGHDHGHAHDHAHDLSHVDADSAEHGDHTGYDTGRERVLILESKLLRLSNSAQQFHLTFFYL